MSVPKQRHTKGRRDRRRKHNDVVKKLPIQTCPKCSTPKLSHKACPNCGFYRGREVVNTMKKSKKKSEK